MPKCYGSVISHSDAGSYQRPGVLLQYIIGVSLSDLDVDLERQYWKGIIEEGARIIHLLHEHGVCNYDIQDKSFMVSTDPTHRSRQVFMMDFGDCVFRDQASSEWQRRI